MQRAWGAVRGAVEEFNNVLNADTDDDELSQDGSHHTMTTTTAAGVPLVAPPSVPAPEAATTLKAGLFKSLELAAGGLVDAASMTAGIRAALRKDGNLFTDSAATAFLTPPPSPLSAIATDVPLPVLPVAIESPSQASAIAVQDRAMVNLVLEAAATLQRELDEQPLMPDATVREAQAENLKWRTDDTSVGVFLESSYEGSPASSASAAMTFAAEASGSAHHSIDERNGVTTAVPVLADVDTLESGALSQGDVTEFEGNALEGPIEDSLVTPVQHDGGGENYDEDVSCFRRIHHSTHVDRWTGPDTVGSSVITAWEKFCDAVQHVKPLKGFEQLQSVVDCRPVTVDDLEPICARTLEAAATMLPLLEQTEKTAQLVPKLNADLSEAQTKISDLTSQIVSVKEQHRKDVESLQLCNARQQTEIVALQGQLDAANEKLRRAYQSQQRNSFSNRLELEDQVDDLTDQLEKWQEAHAVLSESQHRTGAELAEWRERCQMLEPVVAETDILRKRAEEQEILLSDSQRIRHRAAALEEEVSVLRGELSDARDVIARLNSLIETIQKDSVGTSALVERRLRATLSELEACRCRLDEAENRLATATAMEAEFQRLQSANAEAAGVIATFSEENNLLNSSVVKLLKRLEAKAVEEEHFIDRRVLEEKIKKYYETLHSQGMVNLIGAAKEEMLCVIADACNLDTALRGCLGLTEAVSRRVAGIRAVADSPDSKKHHRGISTMFLDFLESEAAA